MPQAYSAETCLETHAAVPGDACGAFTRTPSDAAGAPLVGRSGLKIFWARVPPRISDCRQGLTTSVAKSGTTTKWCGLPDEADDVLRSQRSTAPWRRR